MANTNDFYHERKFLSPFSIEGGFNKDKIELVKLTIEIADDTTRKISIPQLDTAHAEQTFYALRHYDEIAKEYEFDGDSHFRYFRKILSFTAEDRDQRKFVVKTILTCVASILTSAQRTTLGRTAFSTRMDRILTQKNSSVIKHAKTVAALSDKEEEEDHHLIPHQLVNRISTIINVRLLTVALMAYHLLAMSIITQEQAMILHRPRLPTRMVRVIVPVSDTKLSAGKIQTRFTGTIKSQPMKTIQHLCNREWKNQTIHIHLTLFPQPSLYLT